MISYLIQKWIPNAEQTQDKAVRERYCVFSGVMGILCNAVLFCLKLAAGLAAGSISIVSDAFNNLSDMGSSLISIIGAKLSNKRPDREHPFGHGRYEYIAAFAVSFLILLVGVQLARSSIERIIHPETAAFSWLSVIILAFSILVKLWMFRCSRYIGHKIDSSVIRAAAKDSLNDILATIGVLAAAVFSPLTRLPLDGIIGLAVSVFIFLSGIGIARDTIGTLLGRAPDKVLVRQIRAIVLSRSEIIGIHDLMVHDYGPGRVFASLHAEVPDDADILKLHDAIDNAEQEIQQELGIITVIHMDPIAVNDPEREQLFHFVQDIVKAVNREYTIHDFRTARGETHSMLIFDMVVPVDRTPKQISEDCAEVTRRIQAYNPHYRPAIQIDHDFCS